MAGSIRKQHHQPDDQPGDEGGRTTSRVVFETTIDPKALDSTKQGDDATKALLHELKYLARTYFPSPAYMRIDGRPVVWVSLFDCVLEQIERHPYSSGTFYQSILYFVSNVSYGLSRRSRRGISFPSRGFNDRLASWSLDRVMNRNCGQTWLETFAEIQDFYSASNQLDALQIVTWNDYEEGKVSRPAMLHRRSSPFTCAETTAQFSIPLSISVRKKTASVAILCLSHANGENLMPLAAVAGGLHTLDLGRYSLPAGKYLLFVKAVGVASVKSHMFNAATYTVSKGDPDALR